MSGKKFLRRISEVKRKETEGGSRDFHEVKFCSFVHFTNSIVTMNTGRMK
jgi:hypothetical protein